MRNTEYFKNKRVTVVGLARSGSACALLLSGLGAEVSVTDNKDNEATRARRDLLRERGVACELGTHTPEFIRGRDLVVISPGICDEALPVVWAKELGIPVISEIEAAWILCPAKVVAVTGSNGKTTVTTLIGEILKESGRKAFVCGNIGNPFSGEVAKMGEGDFVSLEVSSFQLEHISAFKPDIAVLLNFSRNHLDRYADMEEYLRAKKRMYMNQDPSNYLVLNRADKAVSALAKEAAGRVVYFEEAQGLNPNQAAVMAVGSILGIDAALVRKVFSEFKGVEHRMEYVSRVNGITFINDSKATTVDSAIWALKNIAGPVILIAGGRDKGNDYSLIFRAAQGKVKGVIAIGEAKDKILASFEGSLSADSATSLQEAVKKAFHKASPGDYVLLSPMCSSFDMFSDYEQRGKVFKKAVLGLKGA